MAYTEGCMCHKGLSLILFFSICTTFKSCKSGNGCGKIKTTDCFYLFFLWSHSVVVSTADFESAIVGSNPAGTFYKSCGVRKSKTNLVNSVGRVYAF